MNSLFWALVIIYFIIMFVMGVFNVMTVRHVLKYRYRGDASMAVLMAYVIVLAVTMFITVFSLVAVIFNGVRGVIS